MFHLTTRESGSGFAKIMVVSGLEQMPLPSDNWSSAHQGGEECGALCATDTKYGNVQYRINGKCCHTLYRVLQSCACRT